MKTTTSADDDGENNMNQQQQQQQQERNSLSSPSLRRRNRNNRKRNRNNNNNNKDQQQQQRNHEQQKQDNNNDGQECCSSSSLMSSSSSLLPSLLSSSSSSLIEIDGSFGEGGGQILRNAISYACILGKPIHIYNIRKGRSKPGLKSQHVTGIQMAASISNGTLYGNDINSTEIIYYPPPISTAEEEEEDKMEEEKDNDDDDDHDNHVDSMTTIIGDVKTAGSICLLLQAALPCALLCDKSTTSATSAAATSTTTTTSAAAVASATTSTNTNTNTRYRLVLKGGTNADMAPQYDYWEYIFWPTLCRRCNIPKCYQNLYTNVICRGYYPKGGGHVEMIITNRMQQQQEEEEKQQQEKPVLLSLQPLIMTERGIVKKIYIRSFHAGKVPRHVATTMAKSAKRYLQEEEEYYENDDMNNNDNNNDNNDAKISSSSSKNNTNIIYEVDIITEPNVVGSGSGILLVAETTTGCLFAGSSLGSPNNNKKKKKNANDVGIEAAKELISTLNDGGCVDEWLQDQLILYMALANGRSEIITGSLTLHTRTAIWIAELMCGAKFQVTKISSEETEAETTAVVIDRDEDAANKEDAVNTIKAGYGQDGRIPGRHRIVCEGIGWGSSSSNS